MLTKKLSLLLLSITALLTACGTGEVIKNADTNTFTVSSQYGSVNGSWARASQEAREKAVAYCASMGNKFNLINEERSGVLGYTPQVSNITFSCVADTAEIVKDIRNNCKQEMQSSELDVIRDKVELTRESFNNPPSFDLATNKNYPTPKEKVAIAKWAKIRENCINKENDLIIKSQNPSNAMQKAFTDKLNEFRTQMSAQVSSLIVALYQSKLTYGEFAQKRFEMVSNVMSAERDYRAAILLQDRDAQVKAEQLALQQQQNNLIAWGTYMQSVNARQPQTVQPINQRIQTNCITNKIGNTLTTNCN